MPAARAAEDRRGFVLGGEIAVGVIQSVIGEPAAHLVEEIVALAERIHEIRQRRNLRIR